MIDEGMKIFLKCFARSINNMVQSNPNRPITALDLMKILDVTVDKMLEIQAEAEK